MSTVEKMLKCMSKEYQGNPELKNSSLDRVIYHMHRLLQTDLLRQSFQTYAVTLTTENNEITATMHRSLRSRRGIELVPTPFLLSNYQVKDVYILLSKTIFAFLLKLKTVRLSRSICCSTCSTALRPTPAPSTSPLGRNQPPRAAHEPPREAVRRASHVPRPATAIAAPSSLGDDIQTVMAVLRAVRSSEISDFIRDIRACRNVEDKLSIVVKYHHLMVRFESI
ncbi:hypothetical protein EVAR_56071_1 [Eumeta japonica]|uniref:Uncharacterized protein n=1 Tax=Eumeta variegata TaxID=151549 RepID=A0A4C1YM10_EUMVA|nr:hypothetical protein EVAR_56071_1 [Eumeta japonica]